MAIANDIWLGLIPGRNFGWGHCAHHLARELGGGEHVRLLTDREAEERLPGVVFHELTGPDLVSAFRARGERNVGYTFFENELPAVARENAKAFDLVLAGSTWCRDKLRAAGIAHADVLLQGIDPRSFHPLPDPDPSGPFVIFSGGKFELRKGQDLVLAACRELFPRYEDMVLVTAWHNLWPRSMKTMELSPHLAYVHDATAGSEVNVANAVRAAGLDPRRVVNLPLVPHEELPALFERTQLGVFPNRCEGGTNLVLMEYMACNRPVVATRATGHEDVVDEQVALTLESNVPFTLEGADGARLVDWVDPSLDELVTAIERAWHDRKRLGRLARAGAVRMASMTWQASGEALAKHLEAVRNAEHPTLSDAGAV